MHSILLSSIDHGPDQFSKNIQLCFHLLELSLLSLAWRFIFGRLEDADLSGLTASFARSLSIALL
jgi:hypothetical protein